jgi:hypothetical protein
VKESGYIRIIVVRIHVGSNDGLESLEIGCRGLHPVSECGCQLRREGDPLDGRFRVFLSGDKTALTDWYAMDAEPDGADNWSEEVGDRSLVRILDVEATFAYWECGQLPTVVRDVGGIGLVSEKVAREGGEIGCVGGRCGGVVEDDGVGLGGICKVAECCLVLDADGIELEACGRCFDVV